MSVTPGDRQSAPWIPDPAVMLFSAGYRAPVGVSEDTACGTGPSN